MAIKNSLQQVKGNNAPSQKLTISGYLSQEKIKTWINGMIGSEKEAQKFISSIISATSTTPALQACEPTTIVSSALLANALDLSLSPQLGLAYMVPFEDRKNGRTVATFILGYKGYIQLAIRSGKYRKINVVAVKEGEFVSYNPLTEDLQVNLIADDEEREKAKTVGYYAYFELVNGFQKSLYWSKKKMLLHADRYSKAFSLEAKKGTQPKLDKVSYADFEAGQVPEAEMWKYSSFWYKDFDGMAYKTMLRQLISKWGIMSIDMQEAFDRDGAELYEGSEFNENKNAIRNEIVQEMAGVSTPEQFSEDDFFDDVVDVEPENVDVVKGNNAN
ncbi:MAG: recombinase RecT [Ruminococcus flavefaciens]|nr:recombinase RecT [Ruminococcus flavefaciens]